jgi:hypothetical protein
MSSSRVLTISPALTGARLIDASADYAPPVNPAKAGIQKDKLALDTGLR